MSSLVLLRWVMPVGLPDDSPRGLIEGLISPAVRAAGWLFSPGTTHHVSAHASEVWVTAITSVDDATDVQDELGELLGSPPTLETTHDPLLVPSAEWYRAALQAVTHVGLEVLEARGVIPLSEYEAFESPSEAAPRLMPLLNEASNTYRRASSAYESTESFWLGFFRNGPAPGLHRAGRVLWNLAG